VATEWQRSHLFTTREVADRDSAQDAVCVRGWLRE
jgi:hypothetical protein